MRKKKDIEVVIHKDIEKEMKRIADNIFGYNPKIDPRDPLFRKTLSWSVKKEGKGKKNEKNDWIIKGYMVMCPFIVLEIVQSSI